MKEKQLTVKLTGEPRQDIARLKVVIGDLVRENVRLGTALKNTQKRMADFLRGGRGLNPQAQPPVGTTIMVVWSEGHKQYIAGAESQGRMGFGDTPDEAVLDLMVQIGTLRELAEQAEAEKKVQIATPTETAQLTKIGRAIQ